MNLTKITFLTLLFMLYPSTAHAYIDPGSGMLMLQGLIAAIGACIAFVKDPIGKVKAFFSRFKSKNK
jgi:hypothetical protein